MVVALLSLSAAGCEKDTVPDTPSAGGSGGAGSGGSSGASAGASGSTGTGGTGATGGTGGGSTGGSTGSGGSAGSGASGAGGATGGAGGSGTGGAAGAGPGGAGGTAGGGTGGSGGGGTGGAGGATTDGGGGSAGSGGAGGGTVDAGTPPTPRDPECDLNGRWLVAQRNLLALPLFQCQASHSWYYYEIRHDGTGFVVTKGLHCGFQSVKKSNQSADVSNPAMWPAMQANMMSNGRTGTFLKEADKCHLTLPTEQVIRGATVSHYRNAANPLPVMGSPAAGPGGMPPGWEDWDNDGNPGFSLVINSPAAKGTLYLCTRDTNTIDNTAPLSATLFKIPMTFTTSQVALGTAAGSNPLITSGGTPYENVDSHFTYFQKLKDGEAVGDDTQICEQIRTLKGSLPGDVNDQPPSADCK